MTISDAQLEADSRLQAAMFDGECPEDFVYDLGEPDHRAPVDLVMKHTFDDDGELVSSEVVTPAYSGPSPILVRRDSRQAWAQAKPLDVLKDMAPERLADWVDGMNEVAGFAKYKVA
ncbi:hypothetical protein QDW47_gp40 [Microbacterium phage AnnaLie]|uniref:hypothetical protein n=1 Tax=Microbacterium phage AnnaLie TaxID=2772023 RepID=UPI0018A51C2E|nr:hypothetical protein QDW47_gp40 [Microbacterium phage AnnaLie]QOC59489.1 hypothetical protein SEA_ANNALIE_40 [Microbacterium phage AnnaLie]QUE25518.1 hypothetical protein SEA_BELMONTSKP_40 [Microbacterium phage BelmontSKP]